MDLTDEELEAWYDDLVDYISCHCGPSSQNRRHDLLDRVLAEIKRRRLDEVSGPAR